MSKTRRCSVCKKSYIPRRETSRFCSRRCSLVFHHRPRPKTGKVVACKLCGKKVYIRAYRVKAGTFKYCSRSCLAKVHLTQFAPFRFQPVGRPRHRYKTMTVNGRRVRVHRHKMEQKLGRKLESWEHVHHKNGDSLDNRLRNLEVLSNADHQRREIAERKRILALRRA